MFIVRGMVIKMLYRNANGPRHRGQKVEEWRSVVAVIKTEYRKRLKGDVDVDH